MIVTRLMGGLGNQLFQYALGRHLALRHNTTLYFDLSWFGSHRLRDYSLSCFQIEENFIDQASLGHLEPIRETAFEFDASILEAPDNIHLIGYWQSPKYFSDIEDLIRKDLEFTYPPNRRDRWWFSRISSVASASIHVRRGDYASKARTRRVHGTLPLSYYERAMRYLVATGITTFFVFSDQPAWARNNLPRFARTRFVRRYGGRAAHRDLRLMLGCKSHVIANSSYSWWAAWLSNHADKVVIAPHNWWNELPKGQTDDLLPSEWKLI